MARVPGLGEWYARVSSVRGTVARANGFFEESGADPSYPKRFDEQTRFEGYEQALLSMARTDALTGYQLTYSALGRQPTLLIGVPRTPKSHKPTSSMFVRHCPTSSTSRIEGAGHGVNVQRQDEVNRQLVTFLQDPPP